ncbi:MAG TPA: hypothetical protein VNO52_12395 [Methylomirabilota bacterium]|nr:hypothetical protein [Methylomirabilota bacterium]
MTKSTVFLLSVAMVLGALYIFFFTDWFASRSIQIIPSVRPGRASGIPRAPGSPPVCPVSFGFDAKYRFTSIKVINPQEVATNKFAQPLWHITSDSNSVPTKAIMYGARVPGMKPAVANARPRPLEPDVVYTLLVEAGKLKAQTNFVTRQMVLPGQN